jgi:hypothetical protein
MNRFQMSKFSFLRVAAAGALLAGVASQASAQINFVGVTTYAFSNSNLNTQAAIGSAGLSWSNNATLLGSFHVMADPNSGFNITTVAADANNGDASISTAGNSIGKIVLDDVNNNFSSANNFLYIRTLFSPPSVTPTAIYFKAKVTGVTDGAGNSTVAYTPLIGSVGFLDGVYQNGPFSFSEGIYIGDYQYTLNGHNIATGAAGTIIDGHIFEEHDIDSSVTPEPASLVLIGSGLLGLVAVARRRRNNA